MTEEDLDLRVFADIEKKLGRKLNSEMKALIRYQLDQDSDSLRAMNNIPKDADLEKWR